MSTHKDDMNETSHLDPPKTQMPVKMPAPARPTPRRIMDEGRSALTPPASKKDERVIR